MDIEQYKQEIDRLKEKEQVREREALQEKQEKENEKDKEEEIEFEVIKQHPAFMKLVHALKQWKKQVDDVTSENEGLKEQMDKMNVVNGLEGNITKILVLVYFFMSD